MPSVTALGNLSFVMISTSITVQQEQSSGCRDNSEGNVHE
jgi:hypothetical protein